MADVLAEKALLESFIGVLKDQVNYALMEAVTHRSASMVKLLLASGANPNCFSQPLLVTAVDFNAPDVVYKLIEHGFDVNLRGTHGTALHSAIRVGNLELAEALFKAGGQLNATDDSSTTPLHLAVQTKNINCVEWLLGKGCDVNPVDATWGRTPLHWAAHFTNTEILKLLILFGADLNVLDKNGCAPWTLAVTNKNLQTLDVLFSEQSVNVRDAKMKMPLHWACRSGFTDGVDFLLKKGSNINAKDSEGITPLMDALALRQTQIAEKLIIHKDIDVHIQDTKGRTALHWSCRTGSKSCTQLLLHRGADCNIRDFSNITPFQEAVAIRHSGVAMSLIECGNFDINVRDWRGRTPLHWVSRTGLASCVQLLINAGADVNCQNREGRTPLMDAVLAGELGVMKVLLKNLDINVNQVDYTKQSALHLLLADGPYISMTLLEALAESGADLDLPIPNTGKTPLMHYIKYWPQVAQVLLSVGSNPNLVTEHGDTALLQAVESGSIDIVKLILRANIELDISSIRGRHGVTPVIEACSHEDTDIYKLLVNVGCSLIGVGEFLEEVKDTREHPDIDRELSWLEKRLRQPRTLLEHARIRINKAIGYMNYRKKLDALQIPSGMKEFLLMDGFLSWKERFNQVHFGD